MQTVLLILILSILVYQKILDRYGYWKEKKETQAIIQQIQQEESLNQLIDLDSNKILFVELLDDTYLAWALDRHDEENDEVITGHRDDLENILYHLRSSDSFSIYVVNMN